MPNEKDAFPNSLLTSAISHTGNSRALSYFVTSSVRDGIRCDLTRENIAPIILNTLVYYANKRYYLYDHTVMPDHIHFILQPIERNETVEPLGDILGDIKSYTAHKINDQLGRKGSLWLDESYDRIIRDEKEYRKFARYIFENPERAGLVENAEDWPWWRPGIEPPA
jgi:putative transposase